MKIAIANDHAGLKFKLILKDHLTKQGHIISDFGSFTDDPCDYPDYGIPASKSVSSGENDFAILICGNGMGMSILANKIKNIRAVVVYNENTASSTRQKINANILCLGANEFDKNDLLKFTDIWLKTKFENEERHIRRINKINKLDKNKK